MCIRVDIVLSYLFACTLAIRATAALLYLCLNTKIGIILTPSSASVGAQLAERAFEFEYEYPEYPPPPPSNPGPSRSTPASNVSSSTRVPPSASASARTSASAPRVEDYFQLRDSDFDAAELDFDADPTANAPSVFGSPMLVDPPPSPPAPELPTYESSLKKPRRRRRTKTTAAPAPDLPPLPPGVQPQDGDTRFDWRARALSSSRPRSTQDGWWFRDAWKNRVRPPITKLTEMDGYWLELRRYAEHFVPLLEAEQAEAERQFNERLKVWPDDQLMREGFMLEGMGADLAWQPKYKVEGTVVTFAKTGAASTKPLPPHQFEPGSTVLLSRTDPLVDPAIHAEVDEPLRGTVLSSSRGNIRVVFPSFPDDIELGHWRLDIGCNDFAFRRQKEAIDRLNLDPVTQDMAEFARRKQQQPPAPVSSSIEDEALHATRRKANTEQQVLTGTALRDLLLRRFQADYAPVSAGPAGLGRDRGLADGKTEADHGDTFVDAAEMKPSDVDAVASPSLDVQDSAAPSILARNQLIQSWTRRYRAPEGREPLAVEGDPVVPLNPSQVRAIAMMLSERLSLVQGPPGTGKTRVIVETIKLLKTHWQIPHPILVCAHTNVAVDNLVDGLRAHGVKAVRFGNVARVPADLQDMTLEAKLAEHPQWARLERLKDEKKRLLDDIARPKIAASVKETKQRRINALNGQLYFLKKNIHFEVLANADVVCTTCLSATSRMLDVIDFPFVFLDEASMATEPLSLVPLTKGAAQVAIIGDHKQLPPVIVSEDAQAGGLATSMFERLIHEKHVPSIMLDTQYRMHPSISEFSSKTFYNSMLKDGTVLADGQVRAGLEPPKTSFLLDDEHGKPLNVTFLNHDYPESPANRSIENYHEAGRVCDIVADLLHSNPDLKGSDIGVIAPYVAQIRTITEFLQVDAERQLAFRTWLGDARAAEVADIEVKTVDGFEGREKQVIIFSTVRSNPAGYIGFLADWRRLNVGLTRAKRALIMLGSMRTLLAAKTGQFASEARARVWREFGRWLKARGMVMDDPA